MLNKTIYDISQIAFFEEVKMDKSVCAHME